MAHDMGAHPIHLGLGATAEIEPTFTGEMDWYMGYAQRHEADAAEGRLVSMHTFGEPWDVWEMHPMGHEVVVCTAGTVTLVQQQADGAETSTVLTAGEYAINDPGVWHTADVDTSATCLFITAGMGTEHKPR